MVATYLISLSQHINECLSLLGIVLCEKGKGSAFGIWTSCTSNAMNVILAVLWIVKVDNILNAIDVCFVWNKEIK